MSRRLIDELGLFSGEDDLCCSVGNDPTETVIVVGHNCCDSKFMIQRVVHESISVNFNCTNFNCEF